MKTLIPTLILILTVSLFAQPDTTFSELRGMDDAAGATHLFYRKYSVHSSPPYWFLHNDVYHLNLATQSDSLIFEDYFNYSYVNPGGPTINDFEFWNNDPAKHITCGTYTEVDPGAYIWRYDVGVVWESLGEVFAIEISHQDDSLLYSYHDGLLLKSSDGGYNWYYDPNAAPYFELIAVSPFDDQILFGISGEDLHKSTDGGMSYAIVDSSVAWLDWGRSHLFFDVDSLHVFGVIQGYIQSHLLRSTDAGDSWTLLLSDTNKIHMSLDLSNSGKVFLAAGNELKESDDYGTTFTPYWQLNRRVVGMYKKPNSDLLYVATTKDIYEVTPTDTVSLKHLSTIVSVDEGPQPIVQKFKLHQNYPNPFNPATTIRFDLPKAADVEITVFNIAGQKIAVVFTGRKAAGSHTVEFDGSELGSGVYFYRLVSSDFSDVKKMMLMK